MTPATRAALPDRHPTMQSSRAPSVAVFSTQAYDRQFLDAANAGNTCRLHYFDVALDADTASLAGGHEVACIFVNDRADGDVLKTLAAGGTRLLALRCTGFNNVDLAAARACGIRVVRVSTYSPHSVAEHAVALLLALVRRIPRAWYRTRDGTLIEDLKLQPDGEVRGDRRHFDVVLVHVSREALVGRRLDQMPLPTEYPARIVLVRRGDVDLVPTPELLVEYGDLIGVLLPPERRVEIGAVFGDSVNAEAQFSFMSFGLGLVAGGLLGLVPIPIPGIGTVGLGAAGGVIVMALVFGHLRRVGPFNWSLPHAANAVLRNFGLTLFLASVGMSSGAPFVTSIANDGLTLLLAGVIQVAVVVLIVILGGYFVLRMNYDDVLGIASGATGNPAILAYGNQLCPTSRPDMGYAMIFPGVGTILKIVLVQVMLGWGQT